MGSREQPRAAGGSRGQPCAAEGSREQLWAAEGSRGQPRAAELGREQLPLSYIAFPPAHSHHLLSSLPLYTRTRTHSHTRFSLDRCTPQRPPGAGWWARALHSCPPASPGRGDLQAGAPSGGMAGPRTRWRGVRRGSPRGFSGSIYLPLPLPHFPFLLPLPHPSSFLPSFFLPSSFPPSFFCFCFRSSSSLSPCLSVSPSPSLPTFSFTLSPHLLPFSFSLSPSLSASLSPSLPTSSFSPSPCLSVSQPPHLLLSLSATILSVSPSHTISFSLTLCLYVSHSHIPSVHQSHSPSVPQSLSLSVPAASHRRFVLASLV